MKNREIFLCHSSEDKNSLARPFYNELDRLNISVWYDEAEIHIGDSLLDKIQYGLSRSKYCVVLITPHFMRKDNSYGRAEFKSAIQKQISTGLVSLHAILVGVAYDEFAAKFPLLSERRVELCTGVEDLVKFASYYKGKTDRSKRPLLLDRDQVINEIPTAEKRISGAISEVLISGNDCKFIQGISHKIIDALKSGVDVIIMCVRPSSDTARMLPLIDPRFHSSDYFDSEVNGFIETAKELFLLHSYPGRFQLRTLPVLPSMGFFITDRQYPDGFTKVEIYVAKPFDSRPHFVFDADTEKWREFFHSQWDNYWKIAETGILIDRKGEVL